MNTGFKPIVMGARGAAKRQIAAEIFGKATTSMKNLLKAAEWKFDGDTECEGYKFYKAHVMDQFYPMLEQIFESLEASGLVQECGCGASVKKRNGYRPCQYCNGCGYKNSTDFNDFLP